MFSISKSFIVLNVFYVDVTGGVNCGGGKIARKKW